MPFSGTREYPAAPRSLVWVIPLAVLVAAFALTFNAAVVLASASDDRATASATVNFHETGRLHKISKNGASFTESGSATGTYEGNLTLYVTTTSNGVSFQMLGKGPRGSLRGHGSARINSHGKIGDVSGSAAITGGKKKFAGAYGVDLEVTGTFNRETYGLTVTLSGRMRY